MLPLILRVVQLERRCVLRCVGTCVQQQMLVSRATPGVNTRYEWVQEAYEQLTLCKYEGRPHTGKNWDTTFTNPR
jgi:hypothetical protein